MKYYVTLIKTATDGRITKSIYEFDTENEAVASFHSQLGSAMKDITIKTCLCMAYNSVGGVIKNEHYSNEVSVNDDNN